MSLEFTNKSLTNGGEDTELLRLLAWEYLEELNRMGLIEFIESVGKDNFPVLIAVIPHAQIVDGKITEVTEVVGKEIESEKLVGNPDGEQNAIPISN